MNFLTGAGSTAGRSYETEDEEKYNRGVGGFQLRKDEWARKYTSVDALRETFGRNRNKLWGDLDPTTARRVYKSLLPRALLELHNIGKGVLKPEDLAPLAYRARVAAKLYARERCSLPARIMANLYDGFRQWRKYGHFDTHGMSYQQLWEKYATLVLKECKADAAAAAADDDGEDDDDEDDLTAKICMKILERSCSTNEMVDNLVLSNAPSESDMKKNQLEELERFRATLEDDVRKLLQPLGEEDEVMAMDSTVSASKANRRKKRKTHQQLTAERLRVLKRVAKLRKHLNAVATAKAEAAASNETKDRSEEESEDDSAPLQSWHDRKRRSQQRDRPFVNRSRQ